MSYLVSVVPDCYANTLGHRLARGDDGLVVLLLLCEEGLGRGKRHADIEFSDLCKLISVKIVGYRSLGSTYRNLKTKVGE
jgi:hypothetical protein